MERPKGKKGGGLQCVGHEERGEFNTLAGISYDGLRRLAKSQRGGERLFVQNPGFGVREIRIKD